MSYWNKTIALVIFVMTLINSVAQKPCNRRTVAKQYDAVLPREVCLPKGYIVAAVYDATDVDGDGLRDFIFSWQKEEMQDGDSSFVCIYKRVNDSTFVRMRVFNNLFPIYFRSYGMSYKAENKILMELHSKYGYKNPLEEFRFDGKEFILRIESATGEGNILHYEYDKSIDTWKLYKLEYWISGYLGKMRIEAQPLPRSKLRIEEFDYFDYLD